MPKSAKKKVKVYANGDCERLLKAAGQYEGRTDVKWSLLIHTALVTGMRRAELLNCTWSDIDFESKIVDIEPKADTEKTWLWLIKDTERRVLPLTEELVLRLADHQAQQPEGYPYVFVPPKRYNHIQRLRKEGKWTLTDSRLKVLNNFSNRFKVIQRMANVQQLEFHSLRATALTNWLANGMSEFDVMKLAGHSSFATTHTFYIAVADDLVDRAREVSQKTLASDFVAHLLRTPYPAQNEKRSPNISA
jgi:integrase